MERVLGKPGARALEILVLLLIIVVLLILVYQMAVGYDYRPYSYAMLPALSTPAIGSIEGSNNKARGEVDTLLNAMWWSFNAVTTGGFADFYKPTNMVAKLVTGLIVVGGLVVMGVFIATLSAVYRGEDADELHVMQHELQSSIDKLRQSQEELRKQIEDLRSVM